MMGLQLIIVTMSLALSIAAPVSEETGGGILDLTPTNNEIECRTKSNEVGVCVSFTYCNEDHTIMPGGVIHETEYREMTARTKCPSHTEWCCTKESVMSPKIYNNKTQTVADKCLPLDSDICSWCAKLYKVSDLKYLDTSVYCAGALIGPQVILTSGTCLKAAQHFMIYARIPLSTDPDMKYIAKHRKTHPNYNTGTHHYDFGFMVLEKKVEWRTGVTRGACLNFNRFGANCMTLGFDNHDNFVSTIIQVSSGVCSNMGGGGSSEAYCGKNIEHTQCFAAAGAPVICETSRGIELRGVVRSGCKDNNIAIGSISQSEDWLVKELKNMNVPKDVYIN